MRIRSYTAFTVFSAAVPTLLVACSLVVGEKDVYLFQPDAAIDATSTPDATPDTPPSIDSTVSDAPNSDASQGDAAGGDAGPSDATIHDGTVIDSALDAPPSDGASGDASHDGSSDAPPGDAGDAGLLDAASTDGGPAHDSGLDAVVDSGTDSATCTGTICTAQCVDLKTSATNCGACGHACGGLATCSAGLCSPLPVATDGPIVGFAVDNGNMFLNVVNDAGAGGIDVCAVTGCSSFTHLTTNASEGGNFGARITATGGDVAIFGNAGPGVMDICSESSCPSWTNVSGGSAQVSVWAASGDRLAFQTVQHANSIRVGSLSGTTLTALFSVGSNSLLGAPNAGTPFAVDETHFVWNNDSDAGVGMFICSFDAGCTDKVAMTSPVPDLVDLHAGGVYLAAGGTITTCPKGVCPSPAPFASLAPGLTVSQTVVDTSGLYWIDSAGGISMCPYTGCGDAGAVPVTSAAATPASLFAVSSGYVYFVGTGAASSTVYKVVVPAAP